MRPQLKTGKHERLRKTQQFQQVYEAGSRVSGAHLTFFFRNNQLDCSRLGLTVAKKRFKLSVQRHRIQRLLREAYRLNKARFLPGYDIVLSAHRFKKGETTLSKLQQEILSLAQKAGLLKES